MSAMERNRSLDMIRGFGPRGHDGFELARCRPSRTRSLGIYVAHLFIILYFITWVSGGWWKMNLGWYLIAYALLLLAMWAVAKLYSLLQDQGKRWVGRISRGFVLMVLLAMVVALVAGYLPPPTDTIRIVTSFLF